MPRRKLPAGATVADDRRVGVLSAPRSTSVADVAPALAATEIAEIAQAEARAEAARARAARLRQQADAASTDQGGQTEGESPSRTSRWRRLRPRRPGRKALIAAAAIVVTCAAFAASGYLVWHHRGVERQRQHTAEFAAAARNAVLTMMTLDSSKARDDLQRFVDDTTGMFKISILMGGEDAVKALEQSKVTSKGTVQAVAVESATQDSAVVLVAAKSEITKPGEAKPESRSMRLVVTVQRDGGQLKISRLEFVP